MPSQYTTPENRAVLKACRGPSSGTLHNSMQMFARLVATDELSMEQAWPVLSLHLDAARIPQPAADGASSPRSAEWCAQMCLSILSRPGREHHVPLCLEPRSLRVEVERFAPNIWRWARYFLERYLADPEPHWEQTAIDAAIRSLVFLFHDAFVLPEGVHVLLEIYLSEAMDDSEHVRERVAFAAQDSSYVLSSLVADLLANCYKPLLFGKWKNPRRFDVRAEFDRVQDSLITASFKRLDIIEDDVRLELFYQSLRVPIFLCLVADEVGSPAGYDELVTSDHIASVAALYRFAVCDADLKRDVQVIRKVVALCLQYFQYVCQHRDGWHWYEHLFEEDLLAALWKTQPWMLDIRTIEDADFLRCAVRVGSPSEKRRFLVDEVLLGHLWIYSVFESATLATHALIADKHIEFADVDPRVAALLSNWEPLHHDVKQKLQSERDRCHYSKCPRALTQHVKIKRCAGCIHTFYCSRPCQRAAWKVSGDNHRRTCIPRTLRVALDAIPAFSYETEFCETLVADELEQQKGDVLKALRKQAGWTQVPSDIVLFLDFRSSGPVLGLSRWDTIPISKEDLGVWSDVFDQRDDDTRLLVRVSRPNNWKRGNSRRVGYCVVSRPDWLRGALLTVP